ncbi:MAG: undecaprenyl-phosphate glucose phosphotransferase [Gracilibacteraceae bacterium]|jgi:Undecaprenyl-phosphate glucose phosphotransferase|nr:undecaprenyl-phosphate glucose phosphotransferase [Gracilibacteraceae bacterium]
MIKENQRFLNYIHIFTDAFCLLLAVLAAYGLRFSVLPGAAEHLPLAYYLRAGLALTPLFLVLYSLWGLYESFRSRPVGEEIFLLAQANTAGFAAALALSALLKSVNFSRLALLFFFVFSIAAMSGKRLLLRLALRRLRAKGYNIKHVLLIGAGPLARDYLGALAGNQDLGYQVVGYVSAGGELPDLTRLGGFADLEALLEQQMPDEVVAALEMEDFSYLRRVIHICEKTGTKVSLIPFYAEYIPARPAVDEIDGLPLINIRRIPLDNAGNALLKRTLDICGSLFLIVLTSPLMLLLTLLVKISSPGPVIFRQERLGRGKKPFVMYKFRTMIVNDEAQTAWSTDRDARRTRIGAFLRKFSLDELPQFFNVLAGDMSLVGPRPELARFALEFKESVPLYMVKHQVRPGITGWAQVNGLRGNTSIPRRIDYDLYYIENWSVGFDLRILFLTLVRGANKEVLP